MDAIDRDALVRAFDIARRDPVQRRQVDEWLAKSGSWEEVAESCAAHCQSISLDLMPWQLGPLYYANDLDAVLREPFGDPSGRREAGEVIKKLLALGLSKFEPDPIAAIVAAEQRQPAK